MILGKYPDAAWRPEGTLVGDRILYDQRSGTTTVFARKPIGAPPKSEIEYVVVGDLRSPNERVIVYVPNLRRPQPLRGAFMHNLRHRRLNEAMLAVTGNPFAMRRVARQAEAITEAVLEPFLFYRLPSRGMSLVHAASVAFGGDATIFAGSASVGKTTLAFHYVREGASFLGDAMVIMSEDGRVLSYPGLVKLNGGHLKTSPELETRLVRGMGPRGRYFLRRELSARPSEALDSLPQPRMSEVFDGVTIPGSCELSRVVLIRRGSFDKPSCEAIGADSVAAILSAEVAWELEAAPWRNAQFIYCPSAARGKDFVLEASEHHSRVEEIIRRGTSRAKCYSVSLPYDANISLVGDLVPGVKPIGK
jgi:hypothetical protein